MYREDDFPEENYREEDYWNENSWDDDFREERYRDEPYRDESYRDEPYRDEPYRDEPYRGESYRDEYHRDNAYGRGDNSAGYRSRREERKRRQRRRSVFHRLLFLVVLVVVLAAAVYIGGSRLGLHLQVPSWQSVEEDASSLTQQFIDGVQELIGGKSESSEDNKAAGQEENNAAAQEDSNASVQGDSAAAQSGGDAAAEQSDAAAAAQTAAEDGSDEALHQALTSGPYYFYRQLNEDDQEIYRLIYAGVTNMEKEISCPTRDYEYVYRIEDLMLADHPEIFWYEGRGNSLQYAYKLVLQPEYTVDAVTKAEREKKIAEETAEFMSHVGPDETSYERLATAFNFITNRVSYQANSPDDQNLVSAMIHHQSVCAGYAKGVQYLLQQLGIECLYVWGSVDGRGDHAWNIVNLDGVYYHSDATFGDRSFTDGSTEDHGLPAALAQEYGYLCMSDEKALRDRTISMDLPEGVSVPVCSSEDQSYYRRHGWYFETYSEAVWDDMRQTLASGQTYWRYQFGSKEAYESFLEEIADNRFARMALEELGLSSVRSYTSPNDTLWIVAGWVP